MNVTTITNSLNNTTFNATIQTKPSPQAQPLHRPLKALHRLLLLAAFLVATTTAWGQTSVTSTTVTLDDREDHNWSYYSDADCPVRSLYPADVTITYYGKGTGNMTNSSNSGTSPTSFAESTTSSTVQVNVGETQHTFVYYKTLERKDASTSDAVTWETSRYPYTTIPNPFQVRPTSGTGDDRWRGFYKWRIKSITGGKIYSGTTQYTAAADYAAGNTLAATNMLDAETEYDFVPDAETGMSVELEALWAQAYVAVTGGQYSNTEIPNHSAVGYERNFVVLGQNQAYRYGGDNNPRITQTTRAVTISRYYPDGTLGNANATVRGSNNIAIGADTKFENVAFSNMDANVYIYANGHELIIGRGCSGTIRNIRGVSSNSYRPSHIRLESGTITNFLLGGSGITYNNGTITAKAILGCDYDRAKEDHSKLSITGNIYGGNSFHITSASNRNILSFDWTVKSGTFHNPNDVGYGGGGDEGIYLSSSGLANSDYFGKHYVLIEGGHFASVAGGMDGGYAANDGTPTCKIRMKGGHVYGAIYGAAEFAGAAGDRLFVITGGEVDGWIAGGCNGTATTGGILLGDTYIYIGGNVSVGNSSGGTHVGRDNFNNANQGTRGDTGADGGNIFGAGCGILSRNTYNPYAVNENWKTATVGNVNNSTIVVSDDAHVWRDVHGGGNYGWVADNGTSTIFISGNCTIGGNDGYGNVFGGSNNQQGQEVEVFVKGGDVKGGVYGGSHSWGVINDNVSMEISGGLVEQGVFGGGYGTNSNSCDVTKTVEITMTDGKVLGGLYGGGNVNSKIGGAVTININGGQVGEQGNEANVHGGGLGNLTRTRNSVTVNVGSKTDCTLSGDAVIYGDVYGGSAQGKTNGNTARENDAVTNVTFNKGTINGSLYGGGLGNATYAADVYGPVAVKVYGGTLTGGVYGANNVKGAPQNSVTVDIYGTDAKPSEANKYAIANVYGGGNQAAYANASYPTVTIHNPTSGQMSIGNVYGGGNAAAVTNTNVTVYSGNTIGAVYAGGNGTGVAATFQMVTGNAVAKIYGGDIKRVFAGNNSSGIVNGTKSVTINAGVNEAADAANCVSGSHSPMTIGAVFHGGNQANGSAGTVNIVCTGTSTNEYIDTLFGGANNADIVNNNMSTANDVTLNIDRGHIRTGIFGGNNSGGKVTGKITINLTHNSGGTCTFPYPSVFGGGFGAATETGGNIEVNIGEKTSTATAPTVNATIAGGAVYGGSALGSVNDAAGETTTVNVYNGTITGNIYGGGLGEAGNATKGMVNGVVTVNIGASDQTDANCASDLTACSVYGCNNTGGSPQRDVTVNVYRTGHIPTNEASYTNDDRTYAIDQVFGGGNAADYTPAGSNTATVHVYYCNNTVRRLFAGGNAAAALGVATYIDGGRYEYIFGGGNGEVTAANIGAGGTNLNVSAGLIDHLFGGSNTNGTISGPMRTNVTNSHDCGEHIKEFFGGGNLAVLGSVGSPVSLNTTINCETIFDDIYGGSNLADIIGDVTLTVNGGTIANVWAGSKGVAAGDATYPDGKPANINGNVKLNIYGGDIERAYGGSNVNGNITGTIGVDLDWSQSACSEKEIDYIYGASNQATYTPTNTSALSPTVKLINGTVGVDVYGGGRGASATVTANPKVIAGDATVNANSATVTGNVFGGGDAAPVVGNTDVTVTHTTTVGRNVYGGGNQAPVSVNTNVTLSGSATVTGNVFGGGNQGQVGGDSHVTLQQ